MTSVDPLGTNPHGNCQIFSVDTRGSGLRQLTRFNQGGSPPSVPGCFGPDAPACSVGEGRTIGSSFKIGDEGSRLRLQLRPIRRQPQLRADLRHASRWTRAPPADRCLWYRDQPGRQLPSRTPRAVRILGCASLNRRAAHSCLGDGKFPNLPLRPPWSVARPSGRMAKNWPPSGLALGARDGLCWRYGACGVLGGMKQVSLAEARDRLSSLVNDAAHGGQRIVLSSRGRPKAALIGMEDLGRLERIEREGTALGHEMLRWIERVESTQQGWSRVKRSSTETLREVREGDDGGRNGVPRRQPGAQAARRRGR